MYLSLQNKFHDSVCDKRVRATIGTHDLNSVKAPFQYTALTPTEVSLTPLGESKSCTAAEFMINKKLEVAQLKKSKKRSCNSGIYK